MNIPYNFSDTLSSVIERIKNGDKALKLYGLKGSSRFYILNKIADVLEKPILYITSAKYKAELAKENISFYFGQEPPVLLLKEVSAKEVIFPSVSDEISARLNWLHTAGKRKISIAEAPALFEKFIPRDIFEKSVIHLKKENILSRDDFASELQERGYARADFVEREGQISVRGAIVDVFSPGSSNPIRVEFLGDEIGSIRYFSSEDQRSKEKIDQSIVLPASEIILDAETIESAVPYIQEKASEKEISASVKLSLLEKIRKKARFSTIEWLLPSFYPNLSTVFDYLPQNVLLVFDTPDEISKSEDDFLGSLNDLETLVKKELKVMPDTNELFLTKEELEARFEAFQSISIEDIDITEEGATSVRIPVENAAIPIGEDFESPFEALAEKISEWQALSYSIHIVLQAEIELKKFGKILSERGIKGVEIEIGSLSQGFIFPEGKIVFITEKEIFGEKKIVKPAPKKNIPSAFITSFSQLKPGDYIVHIDFGIGIFRGLTRLKIENREGDFLQCEYQGGDKIYVPVDKLKLVQRYLGDGTPPRIDKLGHENWKKVIKRVKKAVETVAKEILRLYAERKSLEGFQFSKRDKLFREFELAFPYEETPDQEAAIEEVMTDMESSKPMDRLICGDVGFGKTEVAIRAAFKAALDGKQVAFLVPTTLLAYQHYVTSTERLKGYPISIDMLSRFRTAKEAKEICKKLEEGKIDIIIGTHKLLGNKVAFKDLGLVIIDEEQRFGVAHKEKLKHLKKGVDVLTLSATPIPRTLQLSLAGIRDISLINTPPEGRQSVETHVYQSSEALIIGAIGKELERSGAVFFIHNRIEDIFHVAEEIKKLVPHARIDVTHGRMKEHRLERSIEAFIEGKTDVLVTTAIVESGLDIPHANTIIIDDAHTFGLADLYQLRGRVGRSERKAYAYFLVPNRSSLSADAKKRLQVIVELKELGSGFKLALSDLEIRGAGNLFGTSQSGHIREVGLELYLDMLDGAIKELRDESSDLQYEPEIKVNIPAFIPDDYIEDEKGRLLFYKKLSSLKSENELAEIKGELTDRFGDLPESTVNLLKIMELKIEMKKLLIQKIEIRDEEAVIILLENSPLYERFRPGGKYRVQYKRGYAFEELKKRLGELGRSEIIRSKIIKR